MENDFDNLQLYIDEMKATSSSNKKKEILEKWQNNEFILKILLYVNNPYWTYGVTSKAIKKFDRIGILPAINSNDIILLLDNLRNKIFTGHNALKEVNLFILENQQHEQLIYNIIDKDIETRANATLINKVIPNHIPEFKVALANKYEEKLVDFDKEEWYASRKLDGVRCVCIIDKYGNSKFYSRTGKEFTTLGVLQNQIKKHVKCRNIVLDGELCLVDKDGNEDFQSVMKQIRKKDHTIPNPKYHVFDCLTHLEFDIKMTNRKFSNRQEYLDWVNYLKCFELLTQLPMNTISDLDAMKVKAQKLGWEGVMLRKDVGYKGKRSNDLLKVKTFMDAEYKVIRTINDQMRFFEDGKDVSRETMAAVIIYHKGYEVKVGSGFSKEERELYYNDPEKIVGKLITVQYFEETTNQDNDAISLRFPTFKCLHGIERVV